MESDDLKSVKQVKSEPVPVDIRLQVTVCRSNDPYVRLNLFIATNALERLILQHSQQFALVKQAHLGDLVEKQGAAVALFELAYAPGMSIRKCTSFMAEQVTFQQVLWHGRTVYSEKRLMLPCRISVESAGQKFLACASFAFDQDRLV